MFLFYVLHKTSESYIASVTEVWTADMLTAKSGGGRDLKLHDIHTEFNENHPTVSTSQQNSKQQLMIKTK
jgi:hypothetical protein